MYTIAVINPLAGVGKTTISANLGHALAIAGHQVTLVDLDPQGDLSGCLGLFRPPTQGIDQVLLEGQDIASLSISTRNELHLVPAGSRLGEFDQSVQAGREQGLRLQQVLSGGVKGQEYLIFDCPSSSGMLVANALLGVDLALLTMTSEPEVTAGLPRLLETINKFAAARGRTLDYRIVINRLPVRRRLTGVAASQFSDQARGRIFKSAICQTDLITRAGEAGRTVFEFKPNSRAASDFKRLADELRSSRQLAV